MGNLKTQPEMSKVKYEIIKLEIMHHIIIFCFWGIFIMIIYKDEGNREVIKEKSFVTLRR